MNQVTQASNIELEAKIPPQKVTEKHKNLSQGSTTLPNMRYLIRRVEKTTIATLTKMCKIALGLRFRLKCFAQQRDDQTHSFMMSTFVDTSLFIPTLSFS